MGTSSGTRVSAWPSSRATGSGRSGPGSNSAWAERGTSARAAWPRATRSATVRCSTRALVGTRRSLGALVVMSRLPSSRRSRRRRLEIGPAPALGKRVPVSAVPRQDLERAKVGRYPCAPGSRGWRRRSSMSARLTTRARSPAGPGVSAMTRTWDRKLSSSGSSGRVSSRRAAHSCGPRPAATRSSSLTSVHSRTSWSQATPAASGGTARHHPAHMVDVGPPARLDLFAVGPLGNGPGPAPGEAGQRSRVTVLRPLAGPDP